MATLPTRADLDQLPLRAIVAYAARSAARVLTLYGASGSDESVRFDLVDALRIAAQFATGSQINPNASDPLERRLSAAESVDASHESRSVVQAVRATLRATQFGARCEREVDRAEFAEHLITSAARVIDAVMAADPAVGPYLLADWKKLLEFDLGDFPDLGEPIDPSGEGPLGACEQAAPNANSQVAGDPAAAPDAAPGASSAPDLDALKELQSRLEEEREALESQRQFFEHNRQQFAAERDELEDRCRTLEDELKQVRQDVAASSNSERDELAELRERCRQLEEECERLRDGSEGDDPARHPGLPAAEDFAAVPLRASVAFAVRCAIRVRDRFEPGDGLEDAESALEAVDGALRRAAMFAMGSKVQLDVLAAIEAAVGRAVDELAETAADEDVSVLAGKAIYGTINAANLSLGSLNADDFEAQARQALEAVQSAVDFVVAIDSAFASSIVTDWERLQELQLDGFPEFGDPFDPTENGPLGTIEEPASDAPQSKLAEERARLEEFERSLQTQREQINAETEKLAEERRQLDSERTAFEESKRQNEREIEEARQALQREREAISNEEQRVNRMASELDEVFKKWPELLEHVQAETRASE